MHKVENENLETQTQDTLTNAPPALGPAVPRLRTFKPQVQCNSLIHGLTGQYTYLKDFELVAYLKKGASTIKRLGPVGIRETDLLQRIIDNSWRLLGVQNKIECLELSSETHAELKLQAAYPSASLEELEPYIQAEAIRQDAISLERFSRYETRLTRTLQSMNKEFRELQTERMRWDWDNDVFKLSKCHAYKWYIDTLAVAERLLAARKELEVRATEIDAPVDSTTCEDNLLRKKTLHLVTPLTPTTRQTLQKAHELGLLTDIERTLFPKKKVA